MQINILHTYGLGDAIMLGSTIDSLTSNCKSVKLLITQKQAVPVFESIKNRHIVQVSLPVIIKSLIQLGNDDVILNTTTKSFWKFFWLFQLALRAKKIICTESGIYECKFLRYETIYRVQGVEHRACIFSIMANFILKQKLEPILPLYPYFSGSELAIDKVKKVDIIVHLGSNAKYTTKRVKVNYFVKLIKFLAKHNLNRIILVEGPSEKNLSNEFLENVPGAKVFSGTLHDVATLIKKSKIVITNDNGISHIAAAMGAAQVVLHSEFTPIDLRKTGQLNKNIIHVNETEMENDMQTVIKNICDKFKCG